MNESSAGVAAIRGVLNVSKLKARLSATAVFALLLFLAVQVAGGWARHAAVADLRQLGNLRLAQYTSALDNELGRIDSLPGIVALQPEVTALLRRPEDQALAARVNRYLEAVQLQAEASVIYLLDPAGRTLAASNWRQPDSFVGIDLAYRPYFQSARCCEVGRFYGIGTTSGLPGYYYARAVKWGDMLLGVAAVKLGLDALDLPWADGVPEHVVVVDEDGVVILASAAEWTYHTLTPLAEATRQRIQAERRFEDFALDPLGWQLEEAPQGGEQIVSLAAASNGEQRRFLAQERALAGSGWRIFLLSDLANVEVITRGAQAIAGLGTSALLFVALYLRQRRRTVRLKLAAQETLERANFELEQRVVERTQDLAKTNQRLRQEVEERVRTERTLRDTQDELLHAGKLAVLGQMSAGITHELNQPLSALRTLSDNAAKLLHRGMTKDAESNLAMISDIVIRMARITSELKGFAYKSTGNATAVSVKACMASARRLVDPRAHTQGVAIVERIRGEPVALCDGLRVEQVLVNLLGNALDALQDRSRGEILLEVDVSGQRVRIRVRDNGPGIGEDALARLFEPFFTTKAAGVGLGLGLAISETIIREQGGVLRAGNRPEGGAELTIELPAAIRAREVGACQMVSE